MTTPEVGSIVHYGLLENDNKTVTRHAALVSAVDPKDGTLTLTVFHPLGYQVFYGITHEEDVSKSVQSNKSCWPIATLKTQAAMLAVAEVTPAPVDTPADAQLDPQEVKLP